MTIDMDTVLKICGIITSIAAAAGVVYKLLQSFVTKSIKDILKDSMKENSKEMEETIKALDKRISEHIKKSEDSSTDVKTALMRDIRSKINELYNKYVPVGEIDDHTLFILEELFDSYKKLGGNHFTEGQIQVIRTLRVKTDSVTQSTTHN